MACLVDEEARGNPMGGRKPVHEQTSVGTYIAEVPAVSAIVAPLVPRDVTLPAIAESKHLLRFSVLEDSFALALSNVFIQSPDRRAFLNQREIRRETRRTHRATITPYIGVMPL